MDDDEQRDERAVEAAGGSSGRGKLWRFLPPLNCTLFSIVIGTLNEHDDKD